MPYYPKSQVKTNLYASFDNNSPQYIVSATKQPYEGYYYETSTGKKYTGKFPGDGKNLLLIESTTSQFDQNNPLLDVGSSVNPQQIYPVQKINNIETNIRSIPKYYQYPPKLVPEVGSVKRYFCKKRNEYKYIEISKEDHNKLKTNDDSIAYDLYEPISITWEITNQGSNSTIIRRIERELGWIGFFDYVQILKPFDNGRNIKTG